jgi:hypothetical protein
MGLCPTQPQMVHFTTIIFSASSIRWLLVGRGCVKLLQVNSAPLLLLDQLQAGF